MADDYRIYVASLSDYNNGVLHGVWIDDLELKDADDVQEEVNAMLAESPTAEKYGDPAEEWAIHDYEGLPNIGEYESFSYCCELAAALDKHGEAFRALFEYETFDNVEAAVSFFDDNYRGEADSPKDFAQEWTEELLGSDAIDAMGDLYHYVDWEWYWEGSLRDDFFDVRYNGTYYFFYRN